MAFERLDFDTDKIREDIRQEAAGLASTLASRAEQAVEWAGSHLSQARQEAERVAREAQDKAQPVLSDARAKIVDDYVPRVQRATAAAQQAATRSEGTPLSERAQLITKAATQAATQEVTVKKNHPVLKTLGWVAVAACAAGAAYVIWQRSQPVEDPWAEEYWADSEEDAEEEVEVVEAEEPAKA